MEKDGSAAALTGIPVAIAGWLRYLLAVDDEGNAYGLAPDPMKDELRKQMAGITVGEPDSLTDQLKPILANENIWGLNLYEAGIGNKVEEIFREELKGKGAVRAALKQYLT